MEGLSYCYCFCCFLHRRALFSFYCYWDYLYVSSILSTWHDVLICVKRFFFFSLRHFWTLIFV